MKMRKYAAWYVSFSALAGLFMVVSGCSRDPDISDEFARIASQEVSNMDANSSTMIGNDIENGLPKAAAATADTVYYDWNIVRYHWDQASQSYVREATFTNLSDGYTRVRTDTVTFVGNGGARLQYPTLQTVDSVYHIRRVVRTGGGNQLDIRLCLNSALNLSPDTTIVRNGTVTGTYNGEVVEGGATITSVTRQYTNGYWQFPSSGNITVIFPRRQYEVEFTGNGNATLTITNRSTERTRVVLIHVEER